MPCSALSHLILIIIIMSMPGLLQFSTIKVRQFLPQYNVSPHPHFINTTAKMYTACMVKIHNCLWCIVLLINHTTPLFNLGGLGQCSLIVCKERREELRQGNFDTNMTQSSNDNQSKATVWEKKRAAKLNDW